MIELIMNLHELSLEVEDQYWCHKECFCIGMYFTCTVLQSISDFNLD